MTDVLQPGADEVAALRWGLAEADRLFAGLLAASVATCAAAAVALAARDVLEPIEPYVPPAPAVTFVLPLPVPPAVADPAPPAPGTARPSRAVPPAPALPPVPDARRSLVELRAAVDQLGLLGVTGTGTFEDLLASEPGEDVARALEGAVRTGATAAADGAGLRGREHGEAWTIEAPGTAGAGPVRLVEREPSAALPRVVQEAPPVVEGETPRAAVAAWLRGRTPALRVCYERALKRDPSLHGRIEVSLAFEGGRVVRAELPHNELGEAIGACVLQALGRGSPALPGGGEVEVRWPVVFAPAGL